MYVCTRSMQSLAGNAFARHSCERCRLTSCLHWWRGRSWRKLLWASVLLRVMAITKMKARSGKSVLVLCIWQIFQQILIKIWWYAQAILHQKQRHSGIEAVRAERRKGKWGQLEVRNRKNNSKIHARYFWYICIKYLQLDITIALENILRNWHRIYCIISRHLDLKDE